MIPQFTDKKDLFRWLKANKHLLISAKKATVKYADAVSVGPIAVSGGGTIDKAMPNTELLNLSEFPVKVVINTTNIMDGHNDVHIPGLWKKSLAEVKIMYLLQEHRMAFDKVISDKVIPITKLVTWLEMGQDYPGITEALIFDATIEKERNPYMAEQYAKGRVNNHSVGMRYVQIALAMNSNSKLDAEEKAVWDKYIDQVVNRDKAEEQGYFYPVTEARIIEGSAVLMGSNFATPTISMGEKSAISLAEAGKTTSEEPVTWDNLTALLTEKNKRK
jgi:hypothetical protein